MKNKPIDIVLIGTGNLAEQLALALTQCGAGLRQIYGRNEVRARELGELCHTPHTSKPEEVVVADLYLVAVSDRAVELATRPLPIPEGALVAHTAGSVPITALPHPRIGSFYPFQTFTQGRRVDFREIPIFVEASDPQGLEMLREVAQRLSDRVHEANCDRRRRIHLAGVFAANFVNALYGVGVDLVREAGFGFQELKPLIREVATKALDEPTHPRRVQTGPAVRGDRAVLENHRALLDAIYGAGSPENEVLKKIYNEISERIWETSKRTF